LRGALCPDERRDFARSLKTRDLLDSAAREPRSHKRISRIALRPAQSAVAMRRSVV